MVVYKRSHFKRHFFNVLKPLNFSGNFACYRDPLVVLLFLANKEATSLNEILYCHVCHIDCVCRILGKQRRCIFKSSRNPSNSITNTNPNPSLLRIFQTAHSGFFDREKKFRQIWPVSWNPVNPFTPNSVCYEPWWQKRLLGWTGDQIASEKKLEGKHLLSQKIATWF